MSKAESAYEEWLADQDTAIFSPSNRDAFAGGYSRGRREGYAEALKDAVRAIAASKHWAAEGSDARELAMSVHRNAVRAVRALEGEEA